MLDCRSQNETRIAAAANARGVLRGRLLLGLALFALARAGAALAGDPASTTALNAPEFKDPRISAFLSAPITLPAYSRPLNARPFDLPPPISAPHADALPVVSEPAAYSSKDFRPRGRSVYDADPSGSADDNLTFDKTIWQRLNEYRTRDRVRVLTLWESGVSGVSLQTDRKGNPWLQFTSKLNTRGNATHGLLDRLIPVTSFTGNSMRGIVHPGNSNPGAKSSGPFSILHFGSSNAP